MPRGRDASLIEHILNWASRMPWQIDAVLAVSFYLGLHLLYAHLSSVVATPPPAVKPEGNPLNAFNPAVNGAIHRGLTMAALGVTAIRQYVMPALFGVGGIVSLFRNGVAAKR